MTCGEGSIFDLAYVEQLALAKFLGRLSDRITMPVMPDDKPTEYLITQTIADYRGTLCTARAQWPAAATHRARLAPASLPGRCEEPSRTDSSTFGAMVIDRRSGRTRPA